MLCPKCNFRDLAGSSHPPASVPDGKERLWCPFCGYVEDVAVDAPVLESAVAPADVPRGTVEKATRVSKSGRRARKGGRK